LFVPHFLASPSLNKIAFPTPINYRCLFAKVRRTISVGTWGHGDGSPPKPDERKIVLGWQPVQSIIIHFQSALLFLRVAVSSSFCAGSIYDPAKRFQGKARCFSDLQLCKSSSEFLYHLPLNA
jgi:hypothetical protein